MLFNSDSVEEWDAVLDKYSIALDHHVASKKDDTLAELDEWYQNTLPTILATRKPQSIDSSELCNLMSWKLKRGKFRPNLAKLAASNTDSAVKTASQKAFTLITSSSLKAALAEMSSLKGVGPATASAILCAAAPEKVPFMADETMASVPGLGPIAYTAGYYLKFAEKVIDKAAALKCKGAKTSSPHLVEKALWTEYMLDKYNVEKKDSSSSSSLSAPKGAAKKASDTRKGVPTTEKEQEKATFSKRKDAPSTGNDDQEKADQKKKMRSSSRMTRSA
ncbi:hypothetical protein BGZ93_007645 [Podila epicladia]|nr:hypothetical protein BGZ92_000569 [Podila epicladia]KAG0093861.1 hypothetical protein BGZ93_007645 [Podila epicladia]